MPETQILFIIRTISDMRAIGMVVFKNMQQACRAAELGIRIGNATDRGRGYGTRALRLAIAYGWGTLNLHRIGLDVMADNAQALAAYRKVGFLTEGNKRDAAYVGGRWHDMVMMGIIRPE